MNEKILIVIMGLVIIVSVFFIYKNQSGTQKIPVAKQTTSASAIQPSGSHVAVSNACSTSKATGASKKQIFPVSHLVSDGKTDDQKAIQTAITNAGNAGGGIVKQIGRASCRERV